MAGPEKDKDDSDLLPEPNPVPLSREEITLFNTTQKQRVTLRGNLTKAIKAADEFTADFVPSAEARREARKHKMKIENIYRDIEEIDRVLLPLAARSQPEALASSYEKALGYRQAAQVCLMDLQDYVDRCSASIRPVAGLSTSQFTVKKSVPDTPMANSSFTSDGPAPTMLVTHSPRASDIPKFSGEVRRYRDWWQHFEFLVDKKALPLTEKFRLLKLSLSGQAAMSIADLELTDASYELAKTTIKERFGKATDAKSDHVMKIINICNLRDQRTHNDKLSSFVSQVSLNVKALIALGSSYEKLSTTLYPVILGAISQQRREQFSLWTRDRIPVVEGENSELANLMIFLERIADAEREAAGFGNSDSRSFSGSKKPSKNFKNRSQFDRFQSDRSHGRQRQENDQSGSRPSEQSSQSRNTSNRPSGYDALAFATTTSSAADHSCVFCSENHPSFKCKKPFTLDERLGLIAQNNACSKCLRRNHTATRCNHRIPKCPQCSKRHYVLLCDRPNGNSGQPQRSGYAQNSVQSQSPVHSQISGRSHNSASHFAGVGVSKNSSKVEVLLTGHVIARSPAGSAICRILVDPGSMKSYASRSLVEKIQSKSVGSEWLRLLTIGGAVSDISEYDTHVISLQSRFSERAMNVRVTILPEISKGSLPYIQNTFGFEPIADIADEGFPDSIDVVIGANAMPALKPKISHELPDMVAVETIFGWFFNGIDGTDEATELSTSFLALHSAQAFEVVEPSAIARKASKQSDHLERDVDFLWDAEKLGLDLETDNPSADDQLERFVEETIVRRGDGGYVVSLPFREDIEVLGDNERLARSCLSNFLRSNRNNRQLIAAVDKEIQDCIKSGYAEPAPRRVEGQPVHYLPLLAVAKKSQISKPVVSQVRVVKNAAARSRDEASLNDVLHQGPSLIPCIIEVLIFFRMHKIATVADIHKAFLQFQVNPAHRTFLRFFWPLGIANDPCAPVREFWGKSLEFGLICSPFLHCAGLRFHLDSEIRRRPEDSSWLNQVRSRFYVDDIFSGSSSVSEGEYRVRTLFDVFASGRFPLKKWATNSSELGEFMSKQFPDAQVSYQDNRFKLLGVLWDQASDQIGVFTDNALRQFRVFPPTKMTVLEGLSQLFDPLGILVHASINFKSLLQTLWSERRDWREALTGNNLEAFLAFRDQLERAADIRIDRLVVRLIPRSSVERFIRSLTRACPRTEQFYISKRYSKILV